MAKRSRSFHSANCASDGSSQAQKMVRWRMLRCALQNRSGMSAFAPQNGRQLNVSQHVRPSVSGHDLGREPWASHRLRRRRLPARPAADQRGHPGLPRQAPARPVALHHAAPRARHGAGSLRRVCRRQRPAGDDRHSHLADHRQRRPARARLRGNQGQVPPGPRGFHVLGEVRHPRLSRRRARERARDRHAGGGRRHRPQGAGRRDDPRRARADRQTQDRPGALVVG